MGQDSDAVLSPFAIADKNQVLAKIHIFNAQAQAFHEAQAAAIEQFANELVYAGQAGDDLQRLGRGEDCGQLFRPVGPGHIDGAVEFLVEDIAVEKEQGSQRLVLGGGGNVVVNSQVGQEGFDLGGAHFGGVALVVEQDKAPDPADVGFFGAQGIMFKASAFTGLIEQLFGRWGSHGHFLDKRLQETI